MKLTQTTGASPPAGPTSPVERLAKTILRPLLVRRSRPVILKGLLVVLLLGFLSVLLSYYGTSFHAPVVRVHVPQPTFSCRVNGAGGAEGSAESGGGVNDHANAENQLRIDNRAIVFVETPYTPLGQALVILLESNRIRYVVGFTVYLYTCAN